MERRAPGRSSSTRMVRSCGGAEYLRTTRTARSCLGTVQAHWSERARSRHIDGQSLVIGGNQTPQQLGTGISGIFPRPGGIEAALDAVSAFV